MIDELVEGAGVGRGVDAAGVGCGETRGRGPTCWNGRGVGTRDVGTVEADSLGRPMDRENVGCPVVGGCVGTGIGPLVDGDSEGSSCGVREDKLNGDEEGESDEGDEGGIVGDNEGGMVADDGEIVGDDDGKIVGDDDRKIVGVDEGMAVIRSNTPLFSNTKRASEIRGSPNDAAVNPSEATMNSPTRVSTISCASA